MNRKMNILLPVFVFMVVAFFNASPIHSQESFDVLKEIAAGDHKGLAEYYRAQAARYRQLAEKHKKMEVTYVEAQEYWPTTYLPKHCADLVKRSTETAELYEKLAQAEEELSKKK